MKCLGTLFSASSASEKIVGTAMSASRQPAVSEFKRSLIGKPGTQLRNVNCESQRKAVPSTAMPKNPSTTDGIAETNSIATAPFRGVECFGRRFAEGVGHPIGDAAIDEFDAHVLKLSEVFAVGVIEIVEDIRDAVPTLDQSIYANLVRENRQMVQTLRARATSYWNVYHRPQYPLKRDYPALKVLHEMETWAA